MVTINGKKSRCVGMTVAEYLEAEGYDVKRIAVEFNGEILPKTRYKSTFLQDGDSVEIVSFVGGG